MKKINLRGLSEKLSVKELKNVLGGSGGYDYDPALCDGKAEGQCDGKCGSVYMQIGPGYTKDFYCQWADFGDSAGCVCG